VRRPGEAVSPSGAPDVVIVGAGPAGSACAILLAEGGRSVLLLDKATFPRPRVCGEYLSPEAGRILDRLGVLKEVEAAGAQTLRGMRIVAPDGTVLDGVFPTTGRWRGYCDHALAIQRESFDRLLVERARSLPIDVRERHRVSGLLLDGRRVAGVRGETPDGRSFQVSSPLVVGADGRTSVVARTLGLLRPHRLRRLALVQDVGGLTGMADRGEIYVDPPDYSILNPVAPGVVNLSLVVPLAHAKPYAGRLDVFFHARLRQLRHLWPRLGGMEPRGELAAMGPLAYRVRRPLHDGVLLVGDAAGFYDPFTGEGLYTALRSAELLAETADRALAAGDVSRARLSGYDEARRIAFGAKERVTHMVQFLLGRRWRANFAARALTHRPALLAALMGVLGDFVPPGELLRPSLLRRTRG
jgi:menaquinone-9 beta-reductase